MSFEPDAPRDGSRAPVRRRQDRRGGPRPAARARRGPRRRVARRRCDAARRQLPLLCAQHASRGRTGRPVRGARAHAARRAPGRARHRPAALAPSHRAAPVALRLERRGRARRQPRDVPHRPQAGLAARGRAQRRAARWRARPDLRHRRQARERRGGCRRRARGQRGDVHRARRPRRLEHRGCARARDARKGRRLVPRVGQRCATRALRAYVRLQLLDARARQRLWQGRRRGDEHHQGAARDGDAPGRCRAAGHQDRPQGEVGRPHLGHLPLRQPALPLDLPLVHLPRAGLEARLGVRPQVF